MRLRSSSVLWFGGSILFLVVFLSPVYQPAWFSTPLFDGFAGVQRAMRLGLLSLAPVVAWLGLRGTQLAAREKLGAWALALAAAGIGGVVHYWVVDHGHYFSTAYFADNTAWQLAMHGRILRLDPAAIPHSYRFLPDGIVSIFMWLTGSFVASRVAFRLIFDTLLYIAAYRYARVYLSAFFSGGVLLTLVALYPVSILKYAGQLVDPSSHLSFAVCLFCLARRYEPAFAPNLLVGIFSKESVIVMPLCRAFAHGSRRRATLLAAGYLAGAMALAVGIRLLVNHGHTQYMINHLRRGHVWLNLGDYREWGPLYLVSLGVLLPGAILGWKLMDRSFQITCLVIVAGVTVSSELYGSLAEVRNLVPAFIVLAVVNMRYFENAFGSHAPGLCATGPLPSDPAV